MQTPKKKYAPQTRYDRLNTRNITFKFNRKTDADILAWLDSLANRQGYVKALIRADMAARKG